MREKYTGLRKEEDRISHSQFIQKTGLSRRAISKALDILKKKELIIITCHKGNVLNSNNERQGKYILKYSLNLCKKIPELMQKRITTCANSAYNKTNYTKLNQTKLQESPFRTNTVESVGEILNENYK